MELSDDAFLGGALTLLQPRRGHRAGIDAVMLAASIAAKPGEKVLEAGIGAGVAALCLMARVTDIHVTGLERDAAMAELAMRNGDRNGFGGRLAVFEGDVAMPGAQREKHGLGQGLFDHAFANPPYYEEGRARRSPSDARAAASLRAPGSLEHWVRFLVAMTRPRGSITLILPAVLLDEALGLLSGRAGDIAIFPLFPRQGNAALRVIVQAKKGSRAPLRLLRGLILHDDDGSQSAAAEAVLRQGAALDLAPAQ